MKKLRFTSSQIIDALQRADVAPMVPELCRELGISLATFHEWRADFRGMELMKRIGQLENENRLLRKMYVNEKLRDEIVNETHTQQALNHFDVASSINTENSNAVSQSVRCANSSKSARPAA